MKHILSVMANAVAYTFYHEPQPGSVPAVAKKIRIEGGSGIPSARSNFGHAANDIATGIVLHTPEGVVTSIKDEDYELLKEHKVFKKHLEANLVRLVNTDISTNHGAVEKLASGMAHDQFKPLNGNKLGSVTVKLEVQ